jgi:TRAP-type C4-dicarboxylate transport system permease small subunit
VKLLNGFLEVFDRAAFILVAALMGAMGVIAFMAVFYRFVLHDPITWSEEAARYMMVWVTFLGVTMFVEKLPEGARRKVTFAAEIIIMVFLAAVTVQGIKLMIGLWGQTSPAMDFPMWMPYLAIPVGSVYMFMHLLYLVLSRSSQSISTADLELEAALKGKDGAGQ